MLIIKKCRALLLTICLESCKRCGLVGPAASFHGWFKNYCSLKCAQAYRFKQQSQSSITTTAAPVPSLQVIVYCCSLWYRDPVCSVRSVSLLMELWAPENHLWQKCLLVLMWKMLPVVMCLIVDFITFYYYYDTSSFLLLLLLRITFSIYGLCIWISRSEREIMLREVLSEFSQSVLPLPCNLTQMSVTSLWHAKWFSQMKIKLLS